MGVDRPDACIFECLVSRQSPCSECITHLHGAAPGIDLIRCPGIMGGISNKVMHHLQHERPTPRLLFKKLSSEFLNGMNDHNS